MAKNSNTSFAYEALVSIILPEGILNVFEVVNRLTAALTKAVSEGLIDRNPFKLLDPKEKPQKNSSIREFLTIEEVKQLMATPCRYDIVRRAFMFSVPLIEILFVHPSLASSAPEWFFLPILWKTHGMGVNHRVFSKESL